MSAGITLAGSLLSGFSDYYAGRERAQLFNTNATIATEQMRSEAQAGAYNENAIRMRGRALQGQQVAQIGANNLQQAGTPTQVVGGTAMLTEMDALQTRNNALRRAWGFEVQAESDRVQATMASRAGADSAANSILSGAGKAYEQYNATGSWF